MHIFELSKFALSVLSLPISNAYVERVFSIMNIIKSKIRNKINLPLLDSVLRIKFYFLAKNICCKDFIPTKDMCNRFNVNIYDHKHAYNENVCDKQTEEIFHVVDNIFL